MSQKLFLCNTVYQLFVAIWMKHSLFKNDEVDVIVSDHTKDADLLCKRINECNLFDECFYTKNFPFARGYTPTTNIMRRHPNYYLKKYFKTRKCYDEIYVSNVDYFSRLLYNALKKRNKNCKLYLYEDGLSTYSKIFEKRYLKCNTAYTSKIQEFTFKHIFKESLIFSNVSGMYLFNPKYLMWQTDFEIIKLKKIDRTDASFIKYCNHIFNYSNEQDEYSEPYIFMEESFNVEGTPLNDIEILEKVAKNVGKDNIIIKRHPRDTTNRFELNGFKTNQNTAIPWEVVVLNMKDPLDKTIISVCSGSMFNPIIL